MITLVEINDRLDNAKKWANTINSDSFCCWSLILGKKEIEDLQKQKYRGKTILNILENKKIGIIETNLDSICEICCVIPRVVSL